MYPLVVRFNHLMKGSNILVPRKLETQSNTYSYDYCAIRIRFILYFHYILGSVFSFRTNCCLWVLDVKACAVRWWQAEQIVRYADPICTREEGPARSKRPGHDIHVRVRRQVSVPYWRRILCKNTKSADNIGRLTCSGNVKNSRFGSRTQRLHSAIININRRCAFYPIYLWRIPHWFSGLPALRFLCYYCE